MSARCIISASLPSLYQNYQNRWKFDEILTETILHSFLRHGVLYMLRRRVEAVMFLLLSRCRNDVVILMVYQH